MYEEYQTHIKNLENISKALYQKNVVRNEKDGTIDITMRAGELKELAEVQRTILKMKREAIKLKEEIDNENEQKTFL